MNQNITPKEYLNQKGIPYKETNGELVVKCVFNNCDENSRPNERHLYFNGESGQYQCKKCGETGNLITLAKHLGDDSFDKKSSRSAYIKKEKKTELPVISLETVEQYQKALPERIHKYLLERGLNNDSILSYKIGYGDFYGQKWITIPIADRDGNYQFFKLRKDPETTQEGPKYKFFPTGAEATIFGWNFLKEKPSELFICEGEFDCILLHQYGVPAITSTAGAGTFKDEWFEELSDINKIVLAFDKDEAGETATKNTSEKLYKKFPRLQVYRVTYPERMTEGKDITDYFTRYQGNPDELIESLVKIKDPADCRIAKVPQQKEKVTFEQWKGVIQEHFPDMLFATETSCSVITQLLITDVTNPFALVLLDVPSSGKTITINFFSDIPELTYASDRFTPASFVSNAAQVSKKDLDKIDLLPRLRYKMLLARDLATLFSKREEDLNELLGILTRVLDGEGLETDSGVHGKRGYSGEFLFMMLAASTPIGSRVWKMMGSLGGRLLFLNMNIPEKSERELISQIKASNYKQKEHLCRDITKRFLYSLWEEHKDGIVWDKSTEDENILKIIAICAKLLARLRGVVVEEERGWLEEKETMNSIIEQPSRIMQQFYNIARGHAVICRRTNLNYEDIKLVIRLTFDSGKPERTELLKKLLNYGAPAMATSHVMNALKKSETTALARMKTLDLLQIVQMKDLKNGGVGREEKAIQLHPDFLWFTSTEYKKIIGEKVTETDRLLDEYDKLSEDTLSSN